MNNYPFRYEKKFRQPIRNRFMTNVRNDALAVLL